jgi:hypothetical protein
MREMREERTQAYRAAGTALVVVDMKLAERDARFGEQRSSHVKGFNNVHAAVGRDRANDIGFGRPIGAGSGPKLIGR